MILFPRKGGGGHASSGGKSTSKSSSKSSSSSSKFSSTPLSNTGRTSSSTSAGGGKSFVLGSGSIFSGRLAGGGTRTQVYSSYYYGSGYPYGGYGWWVYDRPLPFVYWPVYVYPHGLYGSQEYGPAANISRPGGVLTAATITLGLDASTVYRVMGDNNSVISVRQSLSTKCNATTGPIYAFDPDSTSENASVPHPEQVIQYYRASSFVLSLDEYNNTAALASHAPVSNSTPPTNLTQTPLPAGLNQTFLTCLNQTIASDIPLPDPPTSKHLSSKTIAQIVTFSLFGAMLMGFGLYCFFIYLKTSIVPRAKNAFRARTKRFSEKFKPPWNKTRYATLDAANEDTHHHDNAPKVLEGYQIMP